MKTGLIWVILRLSTSTHSSIPSQSSHPGIIIFIAITNQQRMSQMVTRAEKRRESLRSSFQDSEKRRLWRVYSAPGIVCIFLWAGGIMFGVWVRVLVWVFGLTESLMEWLIGEVEGTRLLVLILSISIFNVYHQQEQAIVYKQSTHHHPWSICMPLSYIRPTSVPKTSHFRLYARHLQLCIAKDLELKPNI